MVTTAIDEDTTEISPSMTFSLISILFPLDNTIRAKGRDICPAFWPRLRSAVINVIYSLGPRENEACSGILRRAKAGHPSSDGLDAAWDVGVVSQSCKGIRAKLRILVIWCGKGRPQPEMVLLKVSTSQCNVLQEFAFAVEMLRMTDRYWSLLFKV